MDTPEFQQALNVETHWTKTYPIVESAVREYFKANPDKELTAAELVSEILPEKEMRGFNQDKQRKRLFKALRVLAENTLADCATRSTLPGERYGVIYYPWNWHAPRPDRIVKRRIQQITCPHCGADIALGKAV